MDWSVGGKYCGCYPPHEIFGVTCTCIQLLKKYIIYPRMKNFLSFFGQKKIGQGGH